MEVQMRYVSRTRRFVTGVLALSISLVCAVCPTAAGATSIRSGQPGFYTNYPFALDARTNLGVNVASGNLYASTDDLQLVSGGPTITRYYNSLRSSTLSHLGPGWTINYGADLRIINPSPYSPEWTETLAGPSGYVQDLTGAASFTGPDGMEGLLFYETDFERYRFVRGDSEVLYFGNDGDFYLSTYRRNGQWESYYARHGSGPAPRKLVSFGPGLQPTSPQEVYFRYDTLDRLAGFGSAAVGQNAMTFGYDSANRVNSAARAGYGTARYGYDANGYLSSIELPDGTSVAATSDTSGRALSVTIRRPGQPDQTTGFEYGAGVTTVTRPDRIRTTYRYDSVGRVVETATLPDPSWGEAVDDPNDDGSAPADGYGDPDEADYCVPDSESGDYCGQNDIGPVTQQYYNEPPVFDPGSAALAAAGTYNRLSYGLADQHLESIQANPTWRQWFIDLGIRKVRRVVPFDVVLRANGPTRCGPQDTASLAEVDAWVAAARARGQEMLISFEHSRGDANPSTCLPTVSEYLQATSAFRARYPDIKLYTAWNEPNHVGQQPTASDPFRAGRFWRNLNWQCQSQCVAVAGDFLDTGFTKTFLDSYKSGAGHNPRIWAWHAYSAGKFKSTDRLRTFLRATRSTSAVWLAEQGAVVQRQRPDGSLTPRLTDTEASARLRFIMDDLPLVSTRIKRLYVYQWVGAPVFDAGLIERDNGQRRNLYTVVKNRTNP
jgi:YD repeat-containing protein